MLTLNHMVFLHLTQEVFLMALQQVMIMVGFFLTLKLLFDAIK
jgi:hypothetical protein